MEPDPSPFRWLKPQDHLAWFRLPSQSPLISIPALHVHHEVQSIVLFQYYHHLCAYSPRPQFCSRFEAQVLGVLVYGTFSPLTTCIKEYCACPRETLSSHHLPGLLIHRAVQIHWHCLKYIKTQYALQTTASVTDRHRGFLLGSGAGIAPR